MQRQRILRAMVETVAERGYADTSVGLVVARAGVSRRTFYSQFGGLEDCFVAVLGQGAQQVIELVSGAFEEAETWQDGVRVALASLLMLLDSEPLLARVWLVESLAAGSRALERRERGMREVLSAIVAASPVTDATSVPPLAPEGTFASVLGVVARRLVEGATEPLIELLGPLTGLAVAPYLDQRGVAREIERGAALARELQAERRRDALPVRDPDGSPAGKLRVLRRDRGGLHAERRSGRLGGQAGEARMPNQHSAHRGEAIPAVLDNPNAHRARRCLLFLAHHADASNREIAAGIGVAHESQISKLLSCLLDERLVDKRSAGAGKRNAWRLTSHGRKVSQLLSREENGT